MTKTYTLVNGNTGQVYGRGLDAETTMHEVLAHDGNGYQIVKELDENKEFLCFRLWWTGRPFMTMAPTVYFSIEPDFDAAIQEIAEKVFADSIRADFPMHAWGDAQWDAIVADSED